MEIKASLVKELRERTGAGMLDCKKALTENEGNIEKAIDWLREKGISKAAKKSGRVAAEGLVFARVTEDHKKAVILEFNSETDFVAKNVDFKEFGNILTERALDTEITTVEELKKLEFGGKTVEAQLTELIAKIGENLNLRRFEVLKGCCDTFVVDYIHMGGKIGVLVKAKGEATEENIEKVRGVAMHVAAMDPKFLSKEQVSSEDLKREEEVLRIQFAEESKAKGKVVKPEMLERIISGKIGKYYEENCLKQQKYVRDDKKTVSEFLKPVDVVAYVRYKVGEGIEKKEEDFAAEVAAQIAGK
ncbi:translation elongation factor Ts [Sneathia sanguinegens]|uniref:translation elongation factor Ts n=1 Tax=Sneathia sanguinegens TaxID=40543 RepID=UPI00082C5ED2|nr:translation elongation factor Ts [Sneathia sanguinegens]MDU4652968.1 translation elongation factor Ts [Sneathia sanguinegens]MDU7496297.1 translation elongation factor Ts [Sneathia sanguinegens]